MRGASLKSGCISPFRFKNTPAHIRETSEEKARDNQEIMRIYLETPRGIEALQLIAIPAATISQS